MPVPKETSPVQRAPWLPWGLLALWVIWIPVESRWSPVRPWAANHFLYQAESFLRGRLDIEIPGDDDLAVFDGKKFVTQGPILALLYMPFVAALGKSPAIPAGATLLLSLINIYLLLSICRKLGLDHQVSARMAAGFLLGTGYWFSAEHHFEAAYNAHVLVSTFLLAMVNESLGRARAWVLGCFIGLGILTRSSVGFSVIFAAAILWKNRHPLPLKPRLVRVLSLLSIVALFCLAFCLYNHARFANCLELGYRYVRNVRQDPSVAAFGTASVYFIPINLYFLLLHGFTLTRGLDVNGTSLLVASPFVLLAFFAKKSLTVIAAWSTVALIALTTLSYAFNGYIQFNCQRYSTDYLPFLYFLSVLGAKEQIRRKNIAVWKAAIAYSVSMNALVLILAERRVLSSAAAAWMGHFHL